LGANQILLTVYTAIGSALAAGAISAFTYANNIQTVPTVILGNSFAMAVFPTLSKKIAENDKDGFAFYLVRALRVIGFLLIPSTVVFILLRAQIARLVIGLGHASWGETKMTALALAAFSISFLAQGLIPLVARAFFALKNTRLPMWVSIVSVISSIILAYPLAEKYSVFGLSLAFSIGSFIQIILLFTYLHKQYPGILDRSLFVSYTRTVFISLFMGVCVWATMHLVANYVDMYRYLGVLIQTAACLIVGLIVYLGTNYLFGAEEIKWAFSRRINGKIVETIPEQMPQ
jgi:putative peptidoglycan lipid II flippase